MGAVKKSTSPSYSLYPGEINSVGSNKPKGPKTMVMAFRTGTNHSEATNACKGKEERSKLPLPLPLLLLLLPPPPLSLGSLLVTTQTHCTINKTTQTIATLYPVQENKWKATPKAGYLVMHPLCKSTAPAYNQLNKNSIGNPGVAWSRSTSNRCRPRTCATTSSACTSLLSWRRQTAINKRRCRRWRVFWAR